MSDQDVVTRLNAALEGRYRIERKLGEGGMATVYLAQDQRHDRNVALKVLKPELAAVVGAERFLAEIKTTANLQHPHILPLFDSGEAEGFLFYVMPYVEGESLRERLDREHQLPVDEAVRIASDVAEALEYAHSHGVIHRDIKPANILLHAGRPLIADFGIALAVSAGGGGRLTETGLSLGTPHYMSPEQATGDLHVGAATDIYALGCVLYEMLVGEPPYTGSTPQAILGKIIQADLVSASKTRRTVPPNVDAVIRKALEKVPADRFASANELGRALVDRAFQHGSGDLGASTPAARGAGAWKPMAVGFASLAAALAIALGWSLTRPAAPTPVSRFALALPGEQAYRTAGNLAGLALTPDAGLIYMGGPSQSARQLWLRPRDQLAAVPLPGTELAGNPSVSPDGTRIAFVSGGSDPDLGYRLMTVGLGGGPPFVVEDSLVDSGGVSWGYDGYIYYDGHLDGDGLARVPGGGGTPEAVTTPRTEDAEQYHVTPEALPNGRGVLFVVRRRDASNIAVVDLRTGAHKVLVRDALAPHYSPTGHLVYLTETGTLVAQPFDQEALQLTGSPVPLADGVQVRNDRPDLAISADGTLAYGSGGPDEWQMTWVTREGSATPIDPRWLPGNVGQPALSPDGRQLAVTVFDGPDGSIWIKQLDGGRLNRLVLEGNSQQATWSPKGDMVAFRFADTSDDGTAEIRRRPADGSAPAEVLYRPESGGVGWPSYSPDGRWLVVQEIGNIVALPLDEGGRVDGEPVPLVTGPFQAQVPAVSPDGRWLAYLSDESGQLEVWVCPFPSSCEARNVISSGGGVVPTWSHDGRSLFYRSRDGEVMSVQVLSGPTFDWDEPVLLFEGPEFRYNATAGRLVLSPDDARFVLPRMADPSAGVQLVVVENFFEVLRQTVPVP